MRHGGDVCAGDSAGSCCLDRGALSSVGGRSTSSLLGLRCWLLGASIVLIFLRDGGHSSVATVILIRRRVYYVQKKRRMRQ